MTTRDYRYQDSGNWKDLLTYYFGWDITYDDIGNPLNYRNGMTMTWEKGRRLASVTKSGVTTTYTYNDDGIRLTKKVGNNALVTYETDGGKVLCQRTRIGTNDVYVFFFYDESGNAYAMKYDGDMYYYLRNGQNDIIGIIDDTGAVVARYTYDPWGKPLTVKDGNGADIAANATHVANVNPFRYRGYFYDTETGFYYLQSRYYDPVTGRFINADGQLNGDSILGFNLFAYCENNPVNLVDFDGEIPIPIQVFADMHRKVLQHICDNNKELGLEYRFTYITGLPQKRFCDLYSTITKECWELKHEFVPAWRAERQLEWYTTGIHALLKEKLTKPRTTVIPSGEFPYTYGDISGTVQYWDAGGGILRYRFIRNESPKKAKVPKGAANYAPSVGVNGAAVAMLAVALAGGLPSYFGGGGKSTLLSMAR